jgi:hypothetical protein
MRGNPFAFGLALRPGIALGDLKRHADDFVLASR